MKELLFGAKEVEAVGLAEESLNKAAELEKLGFKKLAEEAFIQHSAREKIDLLSYLKEYPRITRAMIDTYIANIERKENSIRMTRYHEWGISPMNMDYIKLYWKEIPLESYDKFPPQEVLDKLDVAKGLDLFDSFVIAVIERQQIRVPDPLLLGIINGSTDRYVIAQWDYDIDLEELLK